MGGEKDQKVAKAALVRKEQNEILVRNRALIIGISVYDSTFLRHLDFSRNDGQQTNSLLASLEYETHPMLGEVKWQNMRDSIIHFFTDKTIRPDDILIFYFSGHSQKGSHGENYFATSELNVESPFLRGISFSELAQIINYCQSKKIVLILDTSYSGALKDEIKNDYCSLLASSSRFQTAYSMESEKSHIIEPLSVFTYYLLEGLKGTEESIDAEANVTPSTLARYINSKMKNFTDEKKIKQNPIAKLEGADDIVIAHYPELAKGEYLFRFLKENKVSEFNKIRAKRRSSSLDLHGAYLNGLNLQQVDLHLAYLMDSDLRGADLRGADLRGADLRYASLGNANLDMTDLRAVDLRFADLKGASLKGTNLAGSLLHRANFNEANMSGAYLVTNFAGLSLEGADLRKAYLKGTDFQFAQLVKADLRKTDLNGANFNNANLKEADLRRAKNLPFSIEECILKGAVI